MLQLKKTDLIYVAAHELTLKSRLRPDEPEFDAGTMAVPAHYLAERVCYASHPIDPRRQVMNVFIPAAYLEGGRCHGYTAATAPVLLDVAGGAFRFHRLICLDGHGDAGCTVVEAMNRGFVVACPDYRGCADHQVDIDGDGAPEYTGAAPAQLVDLKAAVRWLRHNAGVLPGDYDKIVVHGISSGGAMTQLVAASGNTHRLDRELAEIGALHERDDVKAAVPFCGPGDLEHADMAMNWYFGRYLYEPQMEEVFNPGKRMTELLPRVRRGPDGKPVLRVNYAAGQTAYDCYDPYAKAYVDEFIRGELGIAEKEYVAELVNCLVPSYLRYRAQHPADCANDYFWWNSYADYLAQGNPPDPFYDEKTYPQQGYIHFDLYRVWCADVAADVAKPTPAFDKIRAEEMPGSENALFGTPKIAAANFTRLGAAQSEVGNGTLEERVLRLVQNQNPLRYLEEPATAAAPVWRIYHGVLDGDIPLPLSFNLMRALQKTGRQASFHPLWKRRHLDCCKGEQDVSRLLDVCLWAAEQ